MSKGQDRSREKLKNFLERKITDLFTGILDYTEVAVDGRERHKNLRSRILKLSNNKIREIKRELDEHYDVDYVTNSVDIVKFNRSKKEAD
jgi:hypothetical protein